MKNPVFMLFCLMTATAQSQNITTSLFASGLSRVVDIQHAGDERLFLVEKAGRIKICNLSGVFNPQPFLNITSIVGSTSNEQGLLGLAFHPNYKNNRYFYVNYTDLAGNSVVARYQTSAQNPDSAMANSAFILMTYTQPFTNHNGGSMNFGPDGYLYISTGDGGSANDPFNNGQNKLTRLGKILRIDVDGSSPYAIPECNPFNNNPDYLPEIWALGLRNPWRCTFDRMTGDYWIADVGQNLWEEVNLQRKSSIGGENYGWRCYEASFPFNTTGCQPAQAYVMPVFEYAHSGPGSGCSVTGGYVYRGAHYADLFGRYFFADYCSGNIWSTDYKSLITVLHGSFNSGTFNCFGEDVYGNLYISKDVGGEIYKIESTNCAPVASFSLTDTLTFCSVQPYVLRSVKSNVLLSYEWYFNGNLISGANADTLVVTQAGNYSLKVMASPSCVSQSPDVYVRFGLPTPAGFTGLPDSTCINYPPVVLNGVPSGGTFSGHGISGNSFVPSVAGAGTHCITYTYINAQGCTSTAVQSIFVNPCLGVPDVVSGNLFQVFPNPASGHFQIKFSSLPDADSPLLLTDVTGKTVFSTIVRVNDKKKTVRIDIPDLAEGLYFVRINQSVQKLFLKKEK